MDGTKGMYSQKHDLPLDHLEYGYIDKCSNVKELEKIIKVLRSGDEGKFPDLEKHAENKLESLNPNHRMLRKEKPVGRPADLKQQEWSDITSDLDKWQQSMHATDAKLHQSQASGDSADTVPIRGSAGKSIPTEKPQQPEPKKKAPMPRSHREWEKVNIDEELRKVESSPDTRGASQVLRAPSNPYVSTDVDTSGWSDENRRAQAEREKEKGNECFRSGDFGEAVLYYTRSLAFYNTPAARNNRAQAYVRQKKWKEAVTDSTEVLQEEADNLKALLRRATAFQGLREFVKAKEDLKKVLSLDSRHKRAKAMLDEVSDELAKQKIYGRRVVIEETSGSEDEADEMTSQEMTGSVSEQKKTSTEMAPASVPENGQQAEHTPTAKDQRQGVLNSMRNYKKAQDENETYRQMEMAMQQMQQLQADKQNEKDPAPLASTVKEETGAKKKRNRKHNRNRKEKRAAARSNTAKQAEKTESAEGSGDGESPGDSPRDGAADDVTKISAQDDVTNAEVTGPRDDSYVLPAAHKEIVCAPKKDVVPVPNKEVVPAPNLEVVPVPNKDVVAVPNKEVVPTPKKEVVPAAETPKVLDIPALPDSVNFLKNKGAELFKSGSYPEALEAYQKSLDKLEKVNDVSQTPNLAMLHSNIGLVKSKLGDSQGCVTSCSAALKLTPGSLKPLLRRARAYEALEKYRLAYVDYRYSLFLDSSQDIAHQGSTRCSQMLLQLDGNKWREKLPPIPSEVPKVFYSTVQTQPAAAPAAGKTEVTSRVHDQEKQFEACKNQGNSFVQKGEYAAAVAEYTKCEALFAGRAVVYTNRALCHLKLGRAEDAVKDCSKALNLDTDNIKALFRRAQAYKMLEEFDDAQEDLTLLLKIDKTNAAAKKEQGILNKLKKEFDLKSQRHRKPLEKKKIPIEEVDGSDDESDVTGTQIPSKEPRGKETLSQKVEPGTKAATMNGVSGQKPQPATKTPANSAAHVIPELTAGTPYEFKQAWQSLKGSTIENYTKLLTQVEAKNLPKVLSNSLDGDLLLTLAQSCAHLAAQGAHARALQYLQQLPQAERFSVAAMFMDAKAKSVLRETMTKISDKVEQFTESDMKKLLKQYEL